jgi:phosphoribosylglycinamide formyltransferase-1
MLNLGIFVSGRGSNFRAIHAAIAAGRLDARVRLLVASKPGTEAAAFAAGQGIPVREEFAALRAGGGYAGELLDALRRHGVDFIALCGYLHLLPAPVVAAYRGRVTNIHPALLPAFGGKGMYGRRVHEAVLASGAALSGATVHVVDEAYDHGPVILQRSVDVLPGDTPETLAARVLEVEHAIYPEALMRLAAEMSAGAAPGPAAAAPDLASNQHGKESP